MSVERRGGGDHQRVLGRGGQEVAHLGEVGRDEVDGAGGVARPGDVGQEVGAVADAIAEGAVQGWPVVQGVHLVDAQGVEAVGVGLDRVEHRDRFAVGQRDDEVRGALEVVEHVIGRARAGRSHRSSWGSGPAWSTRRSMSAAGRPIRTVVINGRNLARRATTTQ